MSLLGNLSKPITRDDLLKLGWERISKNTLTIQIHVNPFNQIKYNIDPNYNYSWFSNYWGESIYYDVKQRILRIRGKVFRNISDMMELNMIIESFTNPKIEEECKQN